MCDDGHVPSGNVDAGVDDLQEFWVKLDDVLRQPVHDIIQIEQRQSSARLQRVVWCCRQQTRALGLKACDERESLLSSMLIIQSANHATLHQHNSSPFTVTLPVAHVTREPQ
jgi:hypothetical protein